MPVPPMFFPVLTVAVSGFCIMASELGADQTDTARNLLRRLRGKAAQVPPEPTVSGIKKTGSGITPEAGV